MTEMAHPEPPQAQHRGNGRPSGKPPSTDIEATIHILEQRLTELEQARYDTLRQVRDAVRRAGEAGLRMLEARVQLCALTECEPLGVSHHDSNGSHRDGSHGNTINEPRAILRLAHLYFDDVGKYRLALCPYSNHEQAKTERAGAGNGGNGGDGGDGGDEGHPIWCSEVVYDSMRPEGNSRITISDATRKAYRAAGERGYELFWPRQMTELE